MKLLFGNFPRGRAAVGLLVVRLVIGSAFVLHGWPKIQNAFGWMGAESNVPGFFQALAALSEFGGGLALILGLLTPLAAFGIACTMIGALTMVHFPRGDPFVAKGGGASFELAAGYFAVMILLLCLGPGAYSVDACLFGRRRTGNKPDGLKTVE